MQIIIFTLVLLSNLSRIDAHAIPTLPLLSQSPVLNSRAYARALALDKSMGSSCDASKLSHDGWKSSFDGLSGSYIGENIAQGYKGDAAQMHRALMASPTHRANILDSHYKVIGVGYSAHCAVAVELFASSASVIKAK